jgi:hypothetical protein
MHRVRTFETPNEHQISAYCTDLHDSTILSDVFRKPWTGYVSDNTADNTYTAIEFWEKNPPLKVWNGFQSFIGKVQSTGEGKSPFLFQVPSGETEVAIVNECYRAPLFQHNPTTSVFLLHDDGRVIPIHKVYLCGQMEPHIAVPVPDKKLIMRNQEAVLVWGILQVMNGKTMEEIRKMVLSEYTLANGNTCGALIRKCNKLIRTLGRQTDEDGRWTRKEVLDPCFDPEYILSKLSPAQLCAEVSSLSAARRLRELGITENPPLSQISKWLSQMKRLREFKRKSIVEMKLQMQRSKCSADDLWEEFVSDILHLDQRIRIGEFVYKELSRAPWNTTSTFLATQVECDRKVGLMLVDSGERHEFVFVLDQTSVAQHRQNRDQTSVDLHRQDFRHVKKKDAMEVLKTVFELPPDEIDALQCAGKAIVNKKLQELSTESVELLGYDNNPLAKFARNEHVVSPRSFLSKCNDIARCQKNILTATTCCLCKEGSSSSAASAASSSATASADERAMFLQSVSRDCSTTPQERNDFYDFVHTLTSPPKKTPTALPSGQPPRQVVLRMVIEFLPGGQERRSYEFLLDPVDLARVSKQQKRDENGTEDNIRK